MIENKIENINWNINFLTPFHVIYNKENPIFYLCQLDFKSYSQSPHIYPMFKDLIQKSNCQKDIKSSYNDIIKEVQLYNQTMKGKIIYPTGFIFHESRVGSTLVANLLGSDPFNMIFSESSVPAEILLRCQRCSRQKHIETFRNAILMMGRSPTHKRLFFKFQSITTTQIQIALEVSFFFLSFSLPLDRSLSLSFSLSIL